MLPFSVAFHGPNTSLSNVLPSHQNKCRAVTSCVGTHCIPGLRLTGNLPRSPGPSLRAQPRSQLRITVLGARQPAKAKKPKTTAEIKNILTKDFQTQQYLVTGNLSEEVYTKFCRISDPTGVIWGIKLYKLIIARLFDAQRSSVKLKKISVTGPSRIEAVWSKQGFLQLPWNPYLTTQEGKTLYTINKEGLICNHKQIWTNMTALQGIKLALTPSKRPS